MLESERRLNKVGLHLPEILFPNGDVSLFEWSVVACDQYTSQPEYWEKIAKIVGDRPSTLNLVLPEIYLDDDSFEERISSINANMDRYLDENILVGKGRGPVVVERTVGGVSRKGLVVAIDLDAYDFNTESGSLIRATEGVVPERLPPRMKIRENASVETPHVLLLMDDKEDIIGQLFREAESFASEWLYDFELMENGGKVRGKLIDDPRAIKKFTDHVEQLIDGSGMLFAVGDGNHSLASAKKHWEEIKKNTYIEPGTVHPAAYALVEIENIHDRGIVFEPIYRLITGCDYKKMISALDAFVKAKGGTFEMKYFAGENAAEKMKGQWEKIKSMNSCQRFAFCTSKVCGIGVIANVEFKLTVGTIQSFLDEFLPQMPDAGVDYIHGEDAIYELGSVAGNIGILLPAIDKNKLFPAVSAEGVLPRKAFSMGEANEKRFYLECRKIR